MGKLLAALLVCIGLTRFDARAAVDVIGEPDASAIRTVVEAQLAAFERDDALAAFAFASPAIRRAFVTPDGFLGMVREHYPVVYRPRTVRFLPPRRVDDQPVQLVEMSDSDGAVWMAIYRLQRQIDGTWLIDGCAVVPGRDITTDAGDPRPLVAIAGNLTVPFARG